MANVKLQVASISDYKTTIGRSVQDYAVLECLTPDNQVVNVAITHNALSKKAGISDIGALDNLIGSTIVATKDTDIRTGEVKEADVRIQDTLNGTYGVFLLNSSNCSILKSESFVSKNNDMQATIKARITIEKEKERKALSLEKANQRFADKLAKLKADKEAAASVEIVEEEALESEVEF